MINNPRHGKYIIIVVHLTTFFALSFKNYFLVMTVFFHGFKKSVCFEE